MSRKASREMAMKLLYQLDFHKENKNQQFLTLLEESKADEKDKAYVMNIVKGVEDHQVELDELIESNAKSWKLGRISKVNIAILRLAIFEIAYRDDIPVNVSINEAVELAKKFSTKDDSAFINGLLGKITPCEKTNIDKKGEE